MKNYNPKVSIITVVLNGEKTIEQTILSVINQTYKNIEYIVIDGKSTDGTLDIINKYSKEISLIISEPDNGLYDAMNKGILYSTGDIIGILNSDDWYEYETVEKVVKSMLLGKAGVIYGDMKCHNEDETNFILKPLDLEEIFIKMPIWHPTVFVRKEIYSQYGLFDKKYKLAADYDLIARFYINKVSFSYLPELLTNFRTTGVSSQKWFECEKEVYNIAYKNVQNSPQKENILIKLKEKYRWDNFKNSLNSNKELLVRLINEFSGFEVKEIKIWGTRNWGKRCRNVLCNSNIKIKNYIDNNGKKWGLVQDELIIQGLQNVSETDYILIAVINGEKEIKEQIICKNKKIKYVSISDLKKYWEKMYFKENLDDIIE